MPILWGGIGHTALHAAVSAAASANASVQAGSDHVAAVLQGHRATAAPHTADTVPFGEQDYMFTVADARKTRHIVLAVVVSARKVCVCAIRIPVTRHS